MPNFPMPEMGTNQIYHSFTDVIKNWPGGISTLAKDAGASPGQVSSWKRRDIIPARYWLDMVERAHERGFIGVTLETLARIAKGKAPHR